MRDERAFSSASETEREERLGRYAWAAQLDILRQRVAYEMRSSAGSYSPGDEPSNVQALSYAEEHGINLTPVDHPEVAKRITNVVADIAAEQTQYGDSTDAA